MPLLTETADYDTPGSWGMASEGWSGIRSDAAYMMYVFANQTGIIPYGSYVLMSKKGEYGSKQSYLRVHKDYFQKLKTEFEAAGSPSADESVKRRVDSGKNYAPKWW